jgi:glutaredoxin 3
MREIIVYTTPICTYCHATKRFLSQKGLAFKEVDLGDKPELRQKLSDEQNGYRTVPMIFIGSHFVGGYTDLVALDKSGKLMPLVQDV